MYLGDNVYMKKIFNQNSQSGHRFTLIRTIRKNLISVKGFTLIEVLVAVAIITVLGLLVISTLLSQIFKGRDAKRKADINRIKIAVEEYEKDTNCFPQYVVCGNVSTQPIYPYLNNVPCDPNTKASYTYEGGGSATCPNWYRIYTVLENKNDPSIISGIGPYNAFNYVSGSSNSPEVTGGTSSTTPPTQTSVPVAQTYYGCKNGICVPLSFDPTRPGAECDPNWYGVPDCGANCGPPSRECVSWH